MMVLLEAVEATREAAEVVSTFTPEKHVYLAYVLVVVLLWGYAALVLMRQKRLRQRLDARRAGE